MRRLTKNLQIATKLVVLAVLAVPGLARAGSYNYTTIDVPGASDTNAYGINNAGQVVGYSNGGVNGSFIESGGDFLRLDTPGQPSGINNVGLVVGFYAIGSTGYGFISNGMSYTTLAVPGASQTGAYGINDSGQVVGFYLNPGPSLAYSYIESGGSYTTFTVPSGASTYAQGIDNAGQVVGYYASASGAAGFVENSGVYTTFTVPDRNGIATVATYATGINNSDEVVGWYEDAVGHFYGFVDSDGVFTTLEVPGATATVAYSVNDSGEIAGYYVDADGINHGFVATLAAVPEPSSVVMTATSILLGLAYVWRRHMQGRASFQV